MSGNNHVSIIAMMNQLKIGWYVLQVNTYYFDNSFLISVGSPDIRCCISVMALECVFIRTDVFRFKERSLPGNFVRSTGTTNASTIRFF